MPPPILDYLQPHTAAPRTSRFAVVTLALSLLTIPSCALMDTARFQDLWENGNLLVAMAPPIIALILNLVAWSRIAHARNRLRGRGVLAVGLVFNTLAIGMAVWVKILIDAGASC
jgi:hypothetical protein